MICSVCLGAAPEGSRFCPSCGRALIDTKSLAGGNDVTRMAVALDETKAAATGAIGTGSYAHALATGAAVVSDAPFAPGTLLAARYRIVRMLGRGGMGVVYQAEDLRLGHAVALKFLPPALAGDPRRLAQFHNEVSLARQVSHPNVCRVYDIGDVDGHLFLSMEYIDGEDLAAAIRQRGRFPESDAVELTRQICAGLAAVHAQGVLHRDLKPANIMINAAGQAQLMDFGIAAAGAVDDLERITEGTPAYMGPSSSRGRTCPCGAISTPSASSCTRSSPGAGRSTARRSTS